VSAPAEGIATRTGARTAARAFHGATVLVVAAALVLQVALVINGGAVLAEDARPDLPTRLGRLCCYFTIQSNVLVLVSTAPLVLDADHDGRWWRVLRLAAVVGITITAVVHFVALRPLLNLEGLNQLADTLLHVVVPLTAMLGWLLLGPRPRVTRPTAALVLAWPVTWLSFALAVGAATDWYPYPFLDPGSDGWGAVVVAAIAIAAAFIALLGLTQVLDRRLPSRGAEIGQRPRADIDS
jgi:hypothetical protein